MHTWHNTQQKVKLIEINMGQVIDLNGGQPVTYAGIGIDQARVSSPSYSLGN
jgi:hypothetical protein